jgi:hypothetical protein
MELRGLGPADGADGMRARWEGWRGVRNESGNGMDMMDCGMG